MLSIFAVLKLLTILIMERKEIQEQRMRNYFIEATRELLKGEGLNSVNVRAIAEKAGYSYATLYNYFRDVKELIFICVKDFQTEAEAFVNERTKEVQPGKESIKATATAFLDYFVQYPGIFELFYLERMSDLSGKQPIAGLIYSFLDRLTEADWEILIEQKIYSKQEAEVRTGVLRSAVTGLLVMYLNRLHPGTYPEFRSEVEQEIAFILD